GLFFKDRRHYQNSADAMALAGVAELPTNPAGAKSRAQQWAANNGVSSGDIKKIEVRTTGFPNDTLYVELQGNFGFIFGRVLGKTTAKKGVKAAALLGHLDRAHQMMP